MVGEANAWSTIINAVADPVTSSLHDEQFQAFREFAEEIGVEATVGRLRRAGVSEEALGEMERRFRQHAGQIRVPGRNGYVHNGRNSTWYAGPRDDDRCWPALKRTLTKKGWDEASISDVDTSSSLIVSLLDHPRLHRFNTQGLVLGHVQSGKTTNFTAVAAKAADRGYRLFIVLAGVHNELRRQTQVRLERELVAPNPELWLRLTNDANDFRPDSNAQSYFGRHNTQPILCVVKKNGAVLRRLIQWLLGAGATLDSVSAIVIDDEADQAAIATPTINPLVRALLAALPRSAYIGYTATPFANLLIDPAAEDLYPKDFVVDLPKPKDHFGTEVLFGRDVFEGESDPIDDGWDMIRRVPDSEIADVRPLTRHDVDGFAPRITGTLEDAVLWFWLATAARRERGTGVKHSTMLIHTSVRVPVHESFKRPLEQYARSIATSVAARAADVIADLARRWADEITRVPAQKADEQAVPFETVLEHLVDVVSETRVVLDNSTSTSRLDYSGEPVVAIAVGGNTLSRGLTLEGLVCSFFVRSATAYDTLLQMGRWFGFRHGYADLPRIWMTEELERWFRDLALVEAEIRRDVRRLMVEDETPETFAVRIRSHPQLAITAAARMRDAVQVSASYGGLRVQTRYFDVKNREWLSRNHRAAARLLETVQRVDHERLDSAFLWRDVDSAEIIEFLDLYRFHDKSIDGRPELLTRYIQNRNAQGSLLTWNVALSTAGTEPPVEIVPGLSVPAVKRARIKTSPDEAADIKTLMSRRDAALDLGGHRRPGLTESEIRTLRRQHLPGHGLVVLYVIDQVSTPLPGNEQSRGPLDAVQSPIGAGLVFPHAEQESVAHWAADLSRIAAVATGEVEHEDTELLELE